MANIYVRSLAGGAATGADWANAKLTLAAAFTAGAAGDSFWVSEDHAETQATAMSLNAPGTDTSPNFVYVVNHLGSVPPVSADLTTGATISTTAASSITMNGVVVFISGGTNGLIITAGSGAVTANILLTTSVSGVLCFVNCALRLGGSSGGNFVLGGNSGVAQRIIWDRTTIQVARTGAGINIQNAWFDWKNVASAISGATLPTTLFSSSGFNAAPGPTVALQGVDLSALGSGKTLIGAPTAGAQNYVLQDCKLGASVTVATTPNSLSAGTIALLRCDSGATNYRHEKYTYAGTQTVETTIVRTGGASDGTTSIAWKLVTTANSKWVLPFEALPIAIWGDTTASTTLTVYGIWGGGAVPNNDDIWMDVEYLGASGNPQGSFISASKADNLAAGSALTADTSTWGGSTTKFKMAVTFTPQQKGAIYVYVKAAKASSTFYIDPKPVLT